jgi:hypothetical protein
MSNDAAMEPAPHDRTSTVDAPEEEINTANDFFLGVGGYPVTVYTFMIPPGPMDAETAIRAAAWLVALADPLQKRFPAVFRAICNT